MAGDAVAQSRAHAELIELAELLGAPVYTEFVPSTASFPATHPLFRGSMIRLAPDVRKVLDQYDVLFSVGGDLFTLSLPSDVDPMPPAIKLIHLDVDPGSSVRTTRRRLPSSAIRRPRCRTSRLPCANA
jgi:benzoylformate decarboxylase